MRRGHVVTVAAGVVVDIDIDIDIDIDETGFDKVALCTVPQPLKSDQSYKRHKSPHDRPSAQR